MNPRQSLSLAVTWPSGYIQMPKYVFLRREGGVLVAPALLFLYYLIAWVWIGPNAKPGVVVTRYEPPEGISPAAARYIASGITDGRSFAAVIAQLASSRMHSRGIGSRKIQTVAADERSRCRGRTGTRGEIRPRAFI